MALVTLRVRRLSWACVKVQVMPQTTLLEPTGRPSQQRELAMVLDTTGQLLKLVLTPWMRASGYVQDVLQTGMSIHY